MHKRWFALILMIAVIPGCSEKRIETAPSEALYETKPTDTVGFSAFFEPEGRIRALPPDIRDAESFHFLGDDIVVFSGYPESCLTLLDGDTFTVKAEAKLPLYIETSMTSAGITYTDELTRELVFLDADLEESKRIPLPDHCGNTVLSSDAQLLYYCTPDSLRVLDLSSGADRPIKEMHFPKQEIIGLHCNDSVIGCRILSDDGHQLTLYVSAETGSLLYETAEEIPLWTEGDLYFTVRMDGAYRQLLSGSADFGPSVLVSETEPIAFTPVLSRKLVLLHSLQPNGSITLDAYHLETGSHTAQITLPEHFQVEDIRPDPQANGLLLLCHNREESRDILLLWNMDESDPEDSRNWLQPRWNSENPDLGGLEQCMEMAAALSETYGVRILLWTDCPQSDDAGHGFEPEYQVPLIRRMLQQLDGALSQYPEGFLEELTAQIGGIRICLIRRISPADPTGVLYWDQQGDVHLMLTPTPELEQQVHRLLFDLIDCRVLSISDAYDSWDRSDPTGSGHRERIRILEAAMATDQTEFFAAEGMRSKLRQICLGIRQTFQTAEAAQSLPWEQHLVEMP